MASQPSTTLLLSNRKVQCHQPPAVLRSAMLCGSSPLTHRTAASFNPGPGAVCLSYPCITSYVLDRSSRGLPSLVHVWSLVTYLFQVFLSRLSALLSSFFRSHCRPTLLQTELHSSHIPTQILFPHSGGKELSKSATRYCRSAFYCLSISPDSQTAITYLHTHTLALTGLKPALLVASVVDCVILLCFCAVVIVVDPHPTHLQQYHPLSHIGTVPCKALLMSSDLRAALNCLRHPSRFMPVSRSQLSKDHTGDSIQNLSSI